jgi:hypothetical protein
MREYKILPTYRFTSSVALSFLLLTLPRKSDFILKANPPDIFFTGDFSLSKKASINLCVKEEV